MHRGHCLRVAGVPPGASSATRCVVVACVGRTGAGITTLVAALASDATARGCPVVPQPDLLSINTMPVPSVWVQGWLPDYDALLVDAGGLDAATASAGLLDTQKVVLVGCLANACVYVCHGTVHRTDKDLLGSVGVVATLGSAELPRALGTLVLCLRTSRCGSATDYLHRQFLLGGASEIPVGGAAARTLCALRVPPPCCVASFSCLAMRLGG